MHTDNANTDQQLRDLETRLKYVTRHVDGQRRRSKALRIGVVFGAALAAALPLASHAYDPVPNAFAAGDPVTAADFNENFEHLVDGLTAAESAAPPIGSIVAWGGAANTVPVGWLICDGAEHDPGTYPDLAMAIGTAHGGDGVASFHVPDLRGRVMRGVDGGVGRDPDAAGRAQPQGGSGNSGDSVGSVQADSLAAHHHGVPINFPGNMPGPGTFGNGSAGVFPDVLFGASIGTVDAQNSATAGAAESRSKNVYVNFIIRAG